MQIKVAPSILAADFGCLAQEAARVAAAGADWLHVDVMDGRFVPNLTFGQGAVAALRRATSLPLDVHLMIEEPERHLETFAAAGADILTVHVEACVHLHRVIQLIRQLGKRVGVALNPATSLEHVRWVLPEVDLVLIMSVNPGFGGQRFLPLALAKLNELQQMVQQAGATVDIEVDGGVDATHAAALIQAGATVLVAGTAVFSAPSLATAIEQLRGVR